MVQFYRHFSITGPLLSADMADGCLISLKWCFLLDICGLPTVIYSVFGNKTNHNGSSRSCSVALKSNDGLVTLSANRFSELTEKCSVACSGHPLVLLVKLSIINCTDSCLPEK
jgi:hypothetical protein